MQNTIESERLLDACVLVVDDVELNRKVLSHSLRGHGYRNVMVACDGAEALALTRTHKPDLVVLDIMMPGMDGFTYIENIRREAEYNGMPILVQTVLTDVDKKVRAFQLGATDYICKPIDPGELCARTKVHLNQKLLIEDLHIFRQRMQVELEAARHMQDRLLPTPQQIQMCERLFNFSIAYHFETSSTLGGDCWGMRPLSDQRLAIYMFDFSGRGISSAMNVFRMHTLIHELIGNAGDPGKFLGNLNRYLHPLLARDELATMFYGILDIDANCLAYATAATPPALLFNQLESTASLLESSGYPLGALPTTSFETRYTPFAEGDALALYSDCLNETQNVSHEFITDEQLKNAVLFGMDKATPTPAQSCVNSLVNLLRSHNHEPVFDDNTIVTFARNMKP